ncbi:hypothetical protein D0Z07_3777 [Hyphodiscus hymeniophilus]|uniref:Uncharacterized protein n=1 Tax=Hyphodiscus hymeniophilus TaxID=353542 RepID=A0A9P6VLX2_9HELO|nr:hypothetical protein D0Z07_3777 [Hyphodiscus hymeniophilus]
MSAPDHNIFHNEEYYHGLSYHDHNQWVHVEADSSRRPPVYNPDNRSCADMAGYSDGQSQVPQAAASPQGCQFENNGNAYYQPPPQSYASSTTSVPCPEGVEREDPDLAVTNTFLPLGPETGLNEVSHRRSASFHSDMPFQLRRYLKDQQNKQPRPSVSPPAQDNFLPQGLHIQSTKMAKDKKKAKPSDQSLDSYSSEDHVFIGCGADPTAYAGNWVEDERLAFGYSSTLSGMTDELNGD